MDMAIVNVKGLPEELREDELEDLRQVILREILKDERVKLKEENITFFFPLDRMKKSSGKEIIVEVEKLFKRAERTPGVLECLAHNIKTALIEASEKGLYSIFKTTIKIKCFVETFDPDESGFSETTRGCWVGM